MLELEFKSGSYKEFVQYLSEILHVSAGDDFIELPTSFGEGYYKALELPNGLQSLISEIEYHSDVLFRRSSSDEVYCTIHFNEIQISDSYKFIKGGTVFEDKNEKRIGVTLTSSTENVDLIIKKGTYSKTINILLPKNWLQENLNRFNELESLTKFTSFSNTLTHPEPFDAQYRILFNEVFNVARIHPLYNLIVKNRIMLLLEHFLSRLYNNVQATNNRPHKKVKTADLSKLMEIESQLVKDFSLQPPTIMSLAENAGMSVSKLKTAFKKVYGTGIYEYYQKNRMQKARSLLLTGQYTVKEVGLQLGYTNLSNFSLAFRKEFGILPSQV